MTNNCQDDQKMISRSDIETSITGLGYIEKGNEELVSPVIQMYREKLEYMKKNRVRYISKKELDITPEKRKAIYELLDGEISKLESLV